MSLLLALGLSAAWAAPFALAPTQIFDGEAFHEGLAVVVDEGVVVDVLPLASLPPGVPVERLDGTLTPGLVDSHVHIFDFPEPMKRGVDRSSWGRFAEEGMSTMVGHRESTLLVGVTTVVDRGGPTGGLVGMQRGLASGKLAGPRVLAVGPVVTAQGGHPVSTVLVGEHDVIEQGTREVSDEAEARAAVQEIAEAGWIQLFVVVEGPEPAPELSPELLAVLVEEAHTKGLRVVGAVVSPAGAARALDAGVDILDHAFPADAALIERMRAAGVAWSPTLGASVGDPEAAALLDAVGRAHAAGVPILAGSGFPASDGARMGEDLYGELALLGAAGLGPTAVLEAATGAPAALGVAAGRLEPGWPADLVLFSSDLSAGVPLPGDVRQVWQAGVPLLTEAGAPTAALEAGLRRKNLVPQGYVYWEPVLTGVVGAGISAFDVRNTGAVAIINLQYSFLRQLGADAELALPSPIPRTSLGASLHYDGFDALWYGVGNDSKDSDAHRYNDTLLRASVEGQTSLGQTARGHKAAFTTGYTLAWTDVTPTGGLPDVAGAEGGWLNTLSLAPSWDGRDSAADPWQGGWASLRVDLSHPVIGADSRSVRPTLDLRGYASLVDWHVLAGRVRVQQAFGAEVPFQHLPSFGGAVGRGFNDDRWLDRLAVSGQLEYRGRVWRAMHVAAFVDVGQVAPSWSELSMSGWHLAVGGGPRVRFNAQAILAWDFGFGLADGGVESFNILFHMGHAF